MFRDAMVAGCWAGLVARLDSSDAAARWAVREPVLSGAVSVGAFAEQAADRRRADEVLGALVRLAAADGGDEPDALLVALHLLSDGALALAGRLADLHVDMVTLVVGELTVRIRTFPWRRRTRAYAANLLLDTRAGLLRELRPGCTRAYPDRREVLVDPLDDRQVATLLDGPAPAAGEGAALELVDLLLWAERTGVASGEDLRLLVEEAWVREFGVAAQETVAARWGVDVRTVRRRRTGTLRGLQAAAGAYLAACA